MTPMPDTASRSTAFSMAWEMVSNRCSGSCRQSKAVRASCVPSHPLTFWTPAALPGVGDDGSLNMGTSQLLPQEETGRRKHFKPDSVTLGKCHNYTLRQSLSPLCKMKCVSARLQCTSLQPETVLHVPQAPPNSAHAISQVQASGQPFPSVLHLGLPALTLASLLAPVRTPASCR